MHTKLDVTDTPNFLQDITLMGNEQGARQVMLAEYFNQV
jgi:hypothetical protein